MAILVVVAGTSFFNSYLTLFSLTSLPGNKMAAGFLFGLAESCSSVVSGVLCTYLKDKYTMMAAQVLFLTSFSVFYFLCGGQFGSTLSLVTIFVQVLGCGSTINITYLLIELRVPAAKLGSSIVVVVTAAMFVSTFASFAAYSAQPVPFVIGLFMSVVSMGAILMLPEPNFSAKKVMLQRTELSQVSQTQMDVTFGGHRTFWSENEDEVSFKAEALELTPNNNNDEEVDWRNPLE